MPKARVLAVDDQLYFRTFLEGLLAEEGYHVETAAGGAEALHALERDRFDVVITDLVMPGMDGSELVRTVKERWPEQDVIVVSGVGDVQTAVGAMKYGATDYLLKPIERTRWRAPGRPPDRAPAAPRARAADAREPRVHGRALALRARAGPVRDADPGAAGGARDRDPVPRDRRAERRALAARPTRRSCSTGGRGGLVQVGEEPARSTRPSCRPSCAGAGRSGGHGCGDRPGRFGLARPVPLRALPDRGSRAGPAAARRQARRQRLRCGGSRARRAARELRLPGDRERAALPEPRAPLVPRPATQAYTRAYFEDVATNEVRKASRFSRHTSLVRVELDGLPALRERLGASEYAHWNQEVASTIRGTLRSMDLLAVESDGRFGIHLPEADSLGATVAKRRVRAAVEGRRRCGR